MGRHEATSAGGRSRRLRPWSKGGPRALRPAPCGSSRCAGGFRRPPVRESGSRPTERAWRHLLTLGRIGRLGRSQWPGRVPRYLLRRGRLRSDCAPPACAKRAGSIPARVNRAASPRDSEAAGIAIAYPRCRGIDRFLQRLAGRSQQRPNRSRHKSCVRSRTGRGASAVPLTEFARRWNSSSRATQS